MMLVIEFLYNSRYAVDAACAAIASASVFFGFFPRPHSAEKRQMNPPPKKKRAYFSVILILSAVIFIFFTEWVQAEWVKVPDIIGENVHDAKRILYDDNRELYIDPPASQNDQDNLDYIVISQTPQSGTLVRKETHVKITTKAKTAVENSSVEQKDEHATKDSNVVSLPSSVSPPKQNASSPTTPTPKQDDTSTSTAPNPNPNTSAPTTPSPTPEPSTPAFTTSTTDSENKTDDFDDTSFDPSFSGNANIGGGTNTGDFQPYEPSTSDYPANSPYSDSAFNGNASLGGGTNAGDFQPYEPGIDDYTDPNTVNFEMPEPA